jgi:hypothetical protein
MVTMRTLATHAETLAVLLASASTMRADLAAEIADAYPDGSEPHHAGQRAVLGEVRTHLDAGAHELSVAAQRFQRVAALIGAIAADEDNRSKKETEDATFENSE